MSTRNITLTEEIQLLTDDICQNGEVDEKCTFTTVSLRWSNFQKARVVVSLVSRLFVPAVAGIYCTYLKGKYSLFTIFGGKLLPAVFAFIFAALRTLQGVLQYNTLPIQTDEYIHQEYYEQHCCDEPEKTVTCCVLSEPGPGQPILADVIFIHGLHGSLVKTWKQGHWKVPKCLTLNPNDNKKSLKEIKTNNIKRSTSVVSNTLKPPIENRRHSTGYSKTELSDNESDFCCHENTDSEDNDVENDERDIVNDGDEPYTECWPRDWLPKDCPGVRVIAVTYTTDPYLWRPVWIKKQTRTSMEERSSEMTEQLLKLGVGKYPIIWVGHSKGGLFVKQMLVDAWERSHDIRLSEIYRNTKAIMFYSVPHRGSKLADFSLPLIRKSVELLEIQKDCEKVLDLHKKFLSVCNDERFKPHIFSFIETSYTFMAFLYLRVVAIESADPGIGETVGVPLDHREICKPRDRDCFLYQQLIHLIHRVVDYKYTNIKKSITDS